MRNAAAEKRILATITNARKIDSTRFRAVAASGRSDMPVCLLNFTAKFNSACMPDYWPVRRLSRIDSIVHAHCIHGPRHVDFAINLCNTVPADSTCSKYLCCRALTCPVTSCKRPSPQHSLLKQWKTSRGWTSLLLAVLKSNTPCGTPGCVRMPVLARPQPKETYVRIKLRGFLQSIRMGPKLKS